MPHAPLAYVQTVRIFQCAAAAPTSASLLVSVFPKRVLIADLLGCVLWISSIAFSSCFTHARVVLT